MNINVNELVTTQKVKFIYNNYMQLYFLYLCNHIFCPRKVIRLMSQCHNREVDGGSFPILGWYNSSMGEIIIIYV